MQIKDVMSTDFQWVPPETTLAEAAKLMKDKSIGFIPIGKDDRLIGTLTDRDIVIRGLADSLDLSTASVKNIMTKKLLYCYEDQELDEICMNMAENKIRRLPVVNKEKRLVGIVSLGDLSHGLAQESGQALKCITEGEEPLSKAA